MLTVHHFGLHFTSGGLGLLVQEGGVQLALDIPMDVQVQVKKPRRTLLCPHDIDLSAAKHLALPSDPLFDVFMPRPKGVDAGPVFLRDDENTRLVVKQLMRLSSPTGAVGMQPLWLFKPTVLVEQLQITNLQPLVVYGYSHHNHSRMTKLVEAARYSPRRLVMILPEMMWWAQPTPTRLETFLSPTDLALLPLERIGAHALRQFMQ